MAIDRELFASWSPAAQEKALAELKKRSRQQWRPFYCPLPGCNGKPHGKWTWKHARAAQHPPSLADDFWFVWALLSGRGTGKTRVGSELTHRMTNLTSRIALVAQTGPDGRNTMIEGELSGLLATAKPDAYPLWEPSKRTLTWPNGCIATVFSAEEPDRLRGPQHGFAWLDEAAHMALIKDVWSNLKLGLRLDVARILVTSTPIPTEWVKNELIGSPTTYVTRESTLVNAHNLAPNYVRNTIDPLRGTRLGRQELEGEILEDVEGALWTMAMIENGGRTAMPIEAFDSIVVSIDPAGTARQRSDKTGLVVVGWIDGHMYLLADKSGRYTPAQWANKAVELFDTYKADKVVAEKNYGGDMVRHTLESIESTLPVEEVDSRRGKEIRAESIVALYEQKRAHHNGDATQFKDIEDQMTSWVPHLKGSESPDRVDALVHAGRYFISKMRAPGSLPSEGIMSDLDPRSALWVPGQGRQMAWAVGL